MPEMVTPEELALINEKFAKEPLLAAYCIPMMAADTERVIDDRALRLDASTIAKYARDAQDGPPLLLSHSHMTSHMGVGRIFQGRDENGKLYLKAYMPPGVDIPNWFGGKFNTDELSKAYDAGLANSVSIGFTFERAECNLCHEDVRSPECPHEPGKSVEVDGHPIECSPVIFAGSKGKLLETSLVWQGALANAKTVKRSELPGQFGAESSEIVLEKGTVPELAQCRFSMSLPKPAGVDDKKETIDLALTHTSTPAKSEPDWGGVDKTKLPRLAFAEEGKPGEKSTWKYPHHWVQNGGNEDANGIYTTGTMYLHRGGLRAAKSAAGGARSGKEASAAVKAHLDAHAKAIGMGENQLAFLDLWQFEPEALAYPALSAVLDQTTEEQFATMVQVLTEEQDRLGENAVTRATRHFEEVGALKAMIIAHSAEVESLKAQIATLTPLSEFGKTYLTGITERAISSGVKLMGNDFQKDFYMTIFQAAASNGDAAVIEKAAEAWEIELAARFTPGRTTVDPDLQPAGAVALSLNGESPPQTFDRLVQEELKANHWGDERYGDAVRAVGRKYPEAVHALKA